MFLVEDGVTFCYVVLIRTLCSQKKLRSDSDSFSLLLKSELLITWGGLKLLLCDERTLVLNTLPLFFFHPTAALINKSL